MPDLTTPTNPADMTAEISAAFDTAMASEPAPTPAPAATAPEGEASASTPPADPATPAPEAPAPAAAPVSLTDDSLVEIVVNGQPQQVRWADARKQVMLHADYTRKTQEVARIREDAQRVHTEAEHAKAMAAQLQQQVAAVFSSREKLAAAYIAASGGEQPPQGGAPQGAPTGPAFPDPVALEQQLMAKITPQVIQQLQAAHVWQTNHNAVTSLTTELIAADPILSKIPGFDNTVYEEVTKMGPTSPAQAQEYIRTYIEGVAQGLAAQRTEAAKAAAVAKAAAATGTERGGSPVTPAKREYDSLNDAQMRDDMLAFLST